jgi:putative ABC transport system permease protein
MVAGAMAGAFTGVVHTRFKVTRLLSGIVTTALAYSFAIRMLGGKANLRATSATIFDQLNRGNLAGVDMIIVGGLACAVLGAACGLLASHLGRLLRAMGDTPWFCVSLGKSASANLVVGLAFANCFVGFAGGLVVHYKRVCDVNMSFGVLVSGLAALVVGETIYASRSLWMHLIMCVVGTWVYNLAVGFFYFDWGTGWTKVFLPSDVRLVTGVLLIGVALVKARSRTYRLFNSEW